MNQLCDCASKLRLGPSQWSSVVTVFTSGRSCISLTLARRNAAVVGRRWLRSLSGLIGGFPAVLL